MHFFHKINFVLVWSSMKAHNFFNIFEHFHLQFKLKIKICSYEIQTKSQIHFKH